jgi:hypothetical protein
MGFGRRTRDVDRGHCRERCRVDSKERRGRHGINGPGIDDEMGWGR